jgi:hypothetical protein
VARADGAVGWAAARWAADGRDLFQRHAELDAGRGSRAAAAADGSCVGDDSTDRGDTSLAERHTEDVRVVSVLTVWRKAIAAFYQTLFTALGPHLDGFDTSLPRAPFATTARR